MIYLDNAATSFPKPQSVINAVKNSMAIYGANPGRSGHDFSVKTAEAVFETRCLLDSFFNGWGSEFVSFTSNCTQALNTAIQGVLKKGDHVIVSTLEHNSVLRPINTLTEKGDITYSFFDVSEDEEETFSNFKKAFNHNTRLCVVTAVSNVFGNILPLRRLSEYAHKNNALFFVDGAQGAGVIPLDMKAQGIDCLCVPGHKGLLGPMGTGAILHNNVDFSPIIQGGTGSDSFRTLQPTQFPERLESGTLNVPGICGLAEGIRSVKKTGIEKIKQRETAISRCLYKGLRKIDGVKLYQGDFDEKIYAPVVSFNVGEIHSEEVSALLNKNGIAVRGGFHCAPVAHITRGTKLSGAVRVSPNFNTTEKEINILLNLVRKIAFNKNI